jgi:hypothetical protein
MDPDPRIAPTWPGSGDTPWSCAASATSCGCSGSVSASARRTALGSGSPTSPSRPDRRAEPRGAPPRRPYARRPRQRRLPGRRPMVSGLPPRPLGCRCRARQGSPRPRRSCPSRGRRPGPSTPWTGPGTRMPTWSGSRPKYRSPGACECRSISPCSCRTGSCRRLALFQRPRQQAEGGKLGKPCQQIERLIGGRLGQPAGGGAGTELAV